MRITRCVLLAILLTVTSALTPAFAATYYLAPAGNGGNDAHSGLSWSQAWLTPRHSINCGDVIYALPSTAYVSNNLSYDYWGNVNCPAGNNVASLICYEPLHCEVLGGGGVAIMASYWRMSGFVVTSTQTGSPCFTAGPRYAGPVEVHHIVFDNDIALGCQGGGFSLFSSGSVSADYVAFIGDIAWNSVQGTNESYSAFDVYAPVQSDQRSGTHIYIADNFAFDNVDGATYGTDGNGGIFDSFSQHNYCAQAVMKNNLFVYNGGRGITLFANSGSCQPTFYIKNNTVAHNNVASWVSTSICAEFLLYNISATTASGNLAVSTAPQSCDDRTPYGTYVYGSPSTTDVFSTSDNYSEYGYPTGSYASTGVNFSSSLLGVNPELVNPVEPGEPSCGGYSTTTACMASVIQDFKPTASAAASYGYQTPSLTHIYDPLYPQWLCNVSLPSGLASIGCAE